MIQTKLKIDDSSCVYCIYGCTDSLALNYNIIATCDDGSCILAVYGCTDSNACNYDSFATISDSSCNYSTASYDTLSYIDTIIIIASILAS